MVQQVKEYLPAAEEAVQNLKMSAKRAVAAQRAAAADRPNNSKRRKLDSRAGETLHTLFLVHHTAFPSSQWSPLHRRACRGDKLHSSFQVEQGLNGLSVLWIVSVWLAHAK